MHTTYVNMSKPHDGVPENLDEFGHIYVHRVHAGRGLDFRTEVDILVIVSQLRLEGVCA